MPRTLEDRIERLEDGTAEQGLAIQSLKSTVDLVLRPMQDKSEARDVELAGLRTRMDKAETAVRTSTRILGGLLALLGLIFTAWEALKR